ncbi:FAD-binding oxidoreductase [Streptomyces chartreusis]|uniref:FAD-binding oxidoreductase n=1 Tax=Streptomyces chartreusis TaxID=1969 RepID=UPI0037FB3D49
MAEYGIERLTGWGRTAATTARVTEPASLHEVIALLQAPRCRRIIARGLGRAYGDAAQNGGGVVARMIGLNRVRRIDAERALITADAGATLDTLQRLALPLGLFPPAMPGTRHVTLGGAVAADVHGKDHHWDGSFAHHVTRLTLHTPTGARETGPDLDPEVFWATVGGMGLTGIITSVTVRMRPIPTCLIRQETRRCSDIDELMARMHTGDPRHRYTAAWIDATATGAQLGRSVLTVGDWATRDQLAPRRHAVHAECRVPSGLPVPPHPLGRLINPATTRAFNTLWYYKAPKQPATKLVFPHTFFQPLDALADWNRLYGPHGLVQYQFTVPYGPEGERTVRHCLEQPAMVGCPPALAVLKRLGPGNPYLSFPRPGWTLALDFPAAAPGLNVLLDRLDEAVLNAGGRLYLAKDSRSRPEVIAAMYPELDNWRVIRDRLDPHGILTSDQAHRLRLTTSAPAGRSRGGTG